MAIHRSIRIAATCITACCVPVSARRTVLLIYVFTQWLAALAMVVANVELRFLWLALATAILVGTVVVLRRRQMVETARKAERRRLEGRAEVGRSPIPKTMLEPAESRGVELLCVGTELLLGNILNGNARWIGERLAGLGLPHYRQSVLGDNRERLIAFVREAAQRAPAC